MTSSSSTCWLNLALKYPLGWEYAIDKGVSVDFPPFPVGPWNVGHISKDPQSGKPYFSNQETLHFRGVSNAWHPTRIDYLELTTVNRYPKGVETKREGKLRLVTHPSFPKPVLMKIAGFPRYTIKMERETLAYKILEGSGIAPKFLGHVTEGGRVVGILLEWIEGAKRAGPPTYDSCLDALKKVHDLGIIHDHTRLDKFLCCEDGRVFVIDFEHSRTVVEYKPRDVYQRRDRHKLWTQQWLEMMDARDKGGEMQKELPEDPEDPDEEQNDVQIAGPEIDDEVNDGDDEVSDGDDEVNDGDDESISNAHSEETIDTEEEPTDPDSDVTDSSCISDDSDI